MTQTSAPPVFTSAVADRLSSAGRPVSEKALGELVRSRRIPAPPVQAGRRLWGREHILAAAKVLGLLTPELEHELAAS